MLATLFRIQGSQSHRLYAGHGSGSRPCVLPGFSGAFWLFMCLLQSCMSIPLACIRSSGYVAWTVCRQAIDIEGLRVMVVLRGLRWIVQRRLGAVVRPACCCV
jgi:hypothetical protein